MGWGDERPGNEVERHHPNELLIYCFLTNSHIHIQDNFIIRFTLLCVGIIRCHMWCPLCQGDVLWRVHTMSGILLCSVCCAITRLAEKTIRSLEVKYFLIPAASGKDSNSSIVFLNQKKLNERASYASYFRTFIKVCKLLK